MNSHSRRLIAAGVLVISACGGPSMPSGTNGGTPGSSCASYAGAWSVLHVDQCGVATSANTTATQTQCSLTFDMAGIGSVTIDVSAPNRPGRVQKTPACENLSLAGSADELSPTRIHVIYGEGPNGCCRHGGFTLTR